jgi:hypothetical protein
MFEISPLLLAIAVSLVGSTLQVWHRHGGPAWTFAVGGFFFILGRLSIATLCAILTLYFLSSVDDMDGNSLLIVGPPIVAILAIGAWSLLMVALYVYRDAFGRAEEEAARSRDTVD